MRNATRVSLAEKVIVAVDREKIQRLWQLMNQCMEEGEMDHVDYEDIVRVAVGMKIEQLEQSFREAPDA